MFGNFTTCRSLLVATMIVAVSPASGVTCAQTVGAPVNDELITGLEIEQRGRLTELSTRKAPAREAVIEELRKEKLKVREAKRFGIDVSDSAVDEAYAKMTGRMRMSPEELTGQLARAGVNVETLKHRIRADLAWRRYQQWQRQDPPPQRWWQDPPPRGRDDV